MTDRDRLYELQRSILEKTPDERDANALRAIFEARLRIERGTYGECVHCGLPIDEHVLVIEPLTTVCEVCAIFQAPNAA